MTAGSWALDSCLLTPRLPPSEMGRRNGQKVKLMGWDKDCLLGQQRKYYNYCHLLLLLLLIIIILVIMIVLNKQDKLYTTQLSRHPMTNSQPVPEQRSQNMELTNFCEFCKTAEKDWTPGKVWTDDLHSQKRERKILSPPPTPFNKLRMMSMVWNISTGQLGLAVWLYQLWLIPAPAHLLLNWIWETGKSPLFLSKTALFLSKTSVLSKFLSY